MLPRFTPLLVPALLLAGCGTYNGGVESAHQPIVQRADYVLDLQTTGYGLAAGENQRLAGWMSAMGLRYGDRVAIDDGAAGTTARDEVAAEAGRYGLMLADRAPVTAGQIAPGTIRVVVTRMTAGVPGCPDHSRAAEYTFEASTSSNYGCATNSNLAAMIADPADLVRGAAGSPTADQQTNAKAIGAYRSAAPSGAGGTKVNAEAPK
ncbi:CpaD family pilus assembly lipoprotein [Sphingomonas sp. HITSZ_GF]|uniref:CpaD family pilus assembly protein n=1 Tax=Sphingomonas sp. HITSZ_GF TaxID=3037247 RepID=UPI00240D6771|nr:CpaD family pilus assembly lipoprotein [Sphingomonas sp. HITSZ_GF]MDG2535482.1 CpaD family pilus assembly lipoprotein [Sphingomonas sp. HITSZ_GF]